MVEVEKVLWKSEMKIVSIKFVRDSFGTLPKHIVHRNDLPFAPPVEEKAKTTVSPQEKNENKKKKKNKKKTKPTSEAKKISPKDTLPSTTLGTSSSLSSLTSKEKTTSIPMSSSSTSSTTSSSSLITPSSKSTTTPLNIAPQLSLSPTSSYTAPAHHYSSKIVNVILQNLEESTEKQFTVSIQVQVVVGRIMKTLFENNRIIMVQCQQVKDPLSSFNDIIQSKNTIPYYSYHGNIVACNNEQGLLLTKGSISARIYPLPPVKISASRQSSLNKQQKTPTMLSLSFSYLISHPSAISTAISDAVPTTIATSLAT